MSNGQEQGFPTSLGVSTASTITLLGRDLPSEIMGEVGFGELALWMVTQRRPTPSNVRLFEACLAALADHGFTPTAIAARMTYLSAPDALQGAIAAGLLGGGSRFLGVTEDTVAFLDATLQSIELLPSSADGWDELARVAVASAVARGELVPGLGHPIHKVADPRTARIFEIAHEEHLFGSRLTLLEAIGKVHPPILGRTLPINGAGVVGAALADLGLPPELLRGASLLARTAGLLAQIAEEIRRPIAMDLYLDIERRATFVVPDDSDEGTDE